MKLGCMLINFNNGTGSRAWDHTAKIRGATPNPSDFLTLCLNSYFATIATDCPFVVVDDGSKDDSVEILDRYADRFTHFVKNKTNIGLTPSMDIAAELLFQEGCDAICRFDGDIEFLTKGWDLRMLQHFLFNRKTAAVGGIQLTPFGGVWAHGDMVIHPDGYTHLLGPKDCRLENCQFFYTGETPIGDMQCDSVMGCLAAFRTTAYKRVNGLREEYNTLRGETEDLNLRLLLEGYRCVSLGSVYFIHRHHESAGTDSAFDTDDKVGKSFSTWKDLWGFDKRKVDLSAVYEQWKGTYLARHLIVKADGQVEYIGPY